MICTSLITPARLARVIIWAPETPDKSSAL